MPLPRLDNPHISANVIYQDDQTKTHTQAHIHISTVLRLLSHIFSKHPLFTNIPCTFFFFPPIFLFQQTIPIFLFIRKSEHGEINCVTI